MKTSIYNLVILDKSGSMSTIAAEAIAGVNETIGTIKSTAEKHADDQQHFFSLVAFCGCERKYIFQNVPIEKVHTISSADYKPCCSTPLYDAIGFSLNQLDVDSSGAEMPLAQVTIITDGYENSSKEFSGKAVKALVEKYKAKGWNFAYIGANQDVNAVSYHLSIDNALCFPATKQGTTVMFDKVKKARNQWFDRVSGCLMSSASASEFYEKLEEEKVNQNFFDE